MVFPSRLMGSGVAASPAQEICGRVLDNQTATGTTQANALLVTASHVVVTTTAAGTGVRLPAPEAGAQMTVKNLGANALLVYPAVGGKINALATNAGFSIAADGQARFVGRNGVDWVTF